MRGYVLKGDPSDNEISEAATPIVGNCFSEATFAKDGTISETACGGSKRMRQGERIAQARFIYRNSRATEPSSINPYWQWEIQAMRRNYDMKTKQPVNNSDGTPQFKSGRIDVMFYNPGDDSKPVQLWEAKGDWSSDDPDLQLRSYIEYLRKDAPQWNARAGTDFMSYTDSFRVPHCDGSRSRYWIDSYTVNVPRDGIIWVARKESACNTDQNSTSAQCGQVSGSDQDRVETIGDSQTQGIDGDVTWRQRLKNFANTNGLSYNSVGPWTGTTSANEPPVPGAPNVAQPPVHTGGYRPGMTVTDPENLAQWGWTASEAKWKAGDIAAKCNVNTIFLALGINDLVWYKASPDQLRSDLTSIISGARASNPHMRFLVANSPNPPLITRKAATGEPLWTDLKKRLDSYNAGFNEGYAKPAY